MNRKVKTVVEFMQENLQEKCSLKQFAEVARLSERQINELFQAEFEMPPCSYFKELRLEKAKRLLLNSALSIKEVRTHIGYSDASDFTRDFKKKYGAAPSHYREQIYFADNASRENSSQF